MVDFSDSATYSPYGLLVFRVISDFYRRDQEADHVDKEHVIEALKLLLDNSKKEAIYNQYIEECYLVDSSPANVTGLLREQRVRAERSRLAQALLDGRSTSTTNLLEQINAFGQLLGGDLGDEEDGDLRIFDGLSSTVDWGVCDAGSRIRLLCAGLTDRINGGALRGHHIVVFGRPEVAKTALVLSIMRSTCRQKLKTIHFGNEDPVESIVERFRSCVSGMTALDRMKDPDATQAALKAKGADYAKFVAITPGSARIIRETCEKYKPDVIIVDQIRNLNTKAENRTNQLENIATEMRNIAKSLNCLVISVTQAGDSASNKRVLEMGDVDSSNTGIPAQADLMIGIGMSKQDEEQGIRVISLPKNKLSGKHEFFPVRLTAPLSRIEDV